MATTYELRTFKDIIDAVCEELQIQSTDEVSRNRIRRDINIIYQEEIIPFEEWKWLRGFTNITLPSKITAGTAAITQNSKTVTLTTAPGISVEGFWFSIDGWNERYTVAKHTANSTTVVLDAEYTGGTLTAQTYMIWTDKLPLPSDCRETIKVTQDFSSEPLDNMGLQKFRDISNTNPKLEARPKIYSTSNYVDPTTYVAISGLPALSTRASDGLNKTLVFASDVSSYLAAGDRIRVSGSAVDSYNGKFIVSTVSTTTVTYTGLTRASESATADASLSVQTLSNQTDSEKYRELWVHPSVFNQRVTLHVDYIKEVNPLINDSDEPLVPLQDRAVLLYGALQRAWARNRNPEESARNGVLYDRKLVKMAGKVDDSTDTPILRPARSYLSTKRRGQRFRGESYGSGGYGGSGSSGPQPTITGASNRAAIFDSTGTLAASSTITTTELALLDGLTSALVTLNDTQTLTNKSISGSTNTISNVPNSATTATSANTASAIVARDASGNFTAGTVTAALTGNASTATTLQTSRNINGTAFNGSADVTVTAAAGTLTGTTLNSTVVTSSLTSVGTLANLTVTNPIVGSVTGNALNVTGIVAVVNGGTNNSATLNNNRVMQSTGGKIQEAAAITASRALVSDANGIPVAATTTTTELNYVSGVTSAIQTQIAAKQTRAGVVDGSNAAAGDIGERIRATASVVSSGATAVWKNIASISLTAGDWDVSGVCVTVTNGATIQGATYALSLFSGTTTTDHVSGDNLVESPPGSTGYYTTGSIPAWRVNVTTTTTVYIKAQMTFSAGTPQLNARISATRIR